MVLLLILVKQVANVTVILSKLHVTLLASLLCLKDRIFIHKYDIKTEVKPMIFKITEGISVYCHAAADSVVETFHSCSCFSRVPAALSDTQSTAPL